MASRGSIEAGKGHVTLGVDRGPLDKGLEAAKQRFESWGKKIAALGAAIAASGGAITAPFLASVGAFSDQAAEISGAARVAGLSLSETQNLAAGLRVGFDELGPASQKMSSFLVDAANGSAEARQALSELGLSMNDLASMSQNDRMLAFADALSRVGDSAKRIDLQRTIFGRQGGALNTSGGRAGIESRASRNRELGGVISDADLKVAREYSAVQKELKVAMAGVWNTFAAVAMPALTAFSKAVVDVVVTVQKWVAENRPLLAIIFRIGSILALVGSAIASVGGALVGFGFVLGFIPTIVTALGTAAYVLAFVVPVVLGCAAAVGVFIGTLYLLGVGFEDLENIWGGLTDFFGQFGAQALDLWSTISQTWGGITDALSAGEWALAGQIALDGLRVAWIQTISYLAVSMWDFYSATANYFENIKIIVAGSMASVVRSVGAGIAAALGSVITAINSAIDALPAWARGGLSRIDLNVGGGIEGLARGIENAGARDPNAAGMRTAVRQTLIDDAQREIAAGRVGLDALTNDAWWAARLAEVGREFVPPGGGPGGGGSLGVTNNSIGTFSRYAAGAMLATGETPAERAAIEARAELEEIRRLMERLLAGGVVMA